MSITSITFLLFVFTLVVVYYIAPLKTRWIWLLICSVFFYVSYDWTLSLWILGIALLIYVAGLILQAYNGRYERLLQGKTGTEKKELKKRAKRRKNVISSVFVLIIAAIWVGFKFEPNSSIIAPLGLSFLALIAISYIVDVKREKVQAQRNFFKLLLWFIFFPQTIQGPIVRYADTSKQLFVGNRFEEKNIVFGAELALWGYFKKLLIANYANVIVTTIFSSRHLGLEYVFGIVLYALQIYCDFSGGIDIVCGVAQMLGIKLPENFKRPYFSRSIEEYWRRWHVTLGAWFRDYIFIPLSISSLANRMGKITRKIFGAKLGNMIPTYCALIIVWSANGIWHGAGINYFLYGFYNGILITLGMQFGGKAAAFAENILKLNRNTFSWKLFQGLRTFTLVCFGRILFKANTFAGALEIYKNMFTHFNPWIFFDNSLYTYGLSAKQLHVLLYATIVLIVVSILQELLRKKDTYLRETIAGQNFVFRYLLCFGALMIILIFGMYGPGYNAGDFIYMKY